MPLDILPPRVGLIVKKNDEGRWLDDNDGDWTELVSGELAAFTGRRPGWDIADHDVAVIDASTREVTYIKRLMNICAGIAVNPSNGAIAVIGTDAINEVRFEPVLNGIFTRVKMALVEPSLDRAPHVLDLNPHLTYQASNIPFAERQKSIGDPRGITWNSSGTTAYVTGMGSDNLVALNAEGERIAGPVSLPGGPAGVVFDSRNSNIYVFSRFAAIVSVVDPETLSIKQPSFIV